jgi:hypothetical protein
MYELVCRGCRVISDAQALYATRKFGPCEHLEEDAAAETGE